MKELYCYSGETYSDICQPAIITETPATFPDPVMPTVIPDTGDECPKTYADMTYLKKMNISEGIIHKLRKKDVNETYMHKIYNLIMG